MSDYPFADFSPREIAVSLVPKPSVDEGLPSDTGTGNAFGDTVGMMVPARGMPRRAAARRTRGLQIDVPTGDSLAGLGTRGMMPEDPGHIDCSFPMPDEQPEEEVPIKPGVAQHAPGTKQVRGSLGMGPSGKSVTMSHRLESKKEQIKIGTEIEKEHFTKDGKPKDKTPKEVATTHVKENPPGIDYYPVTMKPKGAGEKLTWKCQVPAPPKE